MGRPKAEVAAERVMQRVQGVTVTPHFGRIEEKVRGICTTGAIVDGQTPQAVAYKNSLFRLSEDPVCSRLQAVQPLGQ